ncbi:MAG: DUF4870 domain-containing protein [Planctomycetota bacterium]|jgi:uncharacterized Tic20 family protein|nr:hypothetical protein [Planctomycetota bacterium]MDP6368831.1 DUF4870 domain-containing protein [Planctomycetota bacterium]MDP6519259.1 DUF4870 domain-containing protein [Planctomycetota bacterium]MDP6954732.1 DUF4870 domain-containing protein [Planctomycetota bacterium]
MASRKKKDPAADEPEGKPDSTESSSETQDSAQPSPEDDASESDTPESDTPEDDTPEDDTPESGAPEDDGTADDAPEGDGTAEVEAEPYDASSATGPTVEAASDSNASQAPVSSVGGMLCHLSILCHFVAPLLSIAVPLVLWLVLRDEDPEVEHHGREALNLQLCTLLASLLMGVTCIFAFLIPILWLTASVFGILAAVEAHGGRRYRYPGIYRLIP